MGQADGLRQLQDETWAIYEPRVLDWIDQADGDDQRLAEIIKLESTGLNAIEIEAINDLALLHALPERMPSGR